MRVRMGILAAAAVALLAGTADAKELKFAFQGDLKSLDPYSLNETFTLGMLGNVYEGLTKRNADTLAIEPSLATSWELVEPTRWRFKLREGVKFHNGNPFTADDVVFSAERVAAKGSNLTSRLPAGVTVEKVDDYTVDFVTEKPNPIIFFPWDTWFIIDKEWAEANNSVAPSTASDTQQSHITFNTNGTGPFRITSHQAGVKTEFEPNADWWGEEDHNLTKITFTPIAQDATRVAALLAGEVHFMDPVPVQDIQRVNDNAGTSVLTGPELRTIFIGFNQIRPELPTSNVKGKNPFQDPKVRKAFYQAVDIETIKEKIMRGLATPSALMIAPSLFPSHAGEFQRHAHDPEASKKLLAEAGYPEGFEVTMDCPNDRYVNDEAICQAVVSMLAKVGVKVNLLAQPKAKYFAKILASGGYDTDFYLLGWTPGTMDSHNILSDLMACRDETGKTGGAFNNGGYCNKELDALSAQILVETEATKRNAMIRDAFKIAHEDVAYIPLHQQGLAWGKSDKLTLKQRPDNIIVFNHFKLAD